MPLPSLTGNWPSPSPPRLLAAAPEVTFSYAHQKEGVETRPSRLVASIAGTPRPLPSELRPMRQKSRGPSYMRTGSGSPFQRLPQFFRLFA